MGKWNILSEVEKSSRFSNINVDLLNKKYIYFIFYNVMNLQEADDHASLQIPFLYYAFKLPSIIGKNTGVASCSFLHAFEFRIFYLRMVDT